MITDSAGNYKRKPESDYYAIQAIITGEVQHLSANNQPEILHRGTQATDYRIFSIPYELDNALVHQVFEDDLGEYDDSKWQLFGVSGLNLLNYQSIRNQNVEPGKAFLLLVDLQNTFIDGGPGKSTKVADYTTIPLATGWNLIGNPFDFNIPITSLSVEGEVLEAWYTGTNGWTRTIDALNRWEGLAIRVSQNTHLHIAVSDTSAVGKPKLANYNPEDWQIRISVRGEQSLDEDNFIGIYTERSSQQRYIWHEPPRMGNAVSLTVSDPVDSTGYSTGSSEYSTIFREKSLSGYVWDIHLRGDIAGEKVTMDLRQLGAIPLEQSVKLIDMDLNLSYDLDEANWSVLLNMGFKKARKFRIIIGTDQYVMEQLNALPLIPDNYELKQNYPNPFNLSTSIQFGIPQDQTVYLDIYNILGQKVRTLLNGQYFQPGYHLIEWDGRNDASQIVSSGVYIFRFRAGSEVKLMKGVLAK